jgi:hypothetical protein
MEMVWKIIQMNQGRHYKRDGTKKWNETQVTHKHHMLHWKLNTTLLLQVQWSEAWSQWYWWNSEGCGIGIRYL